MIVNATATPPATGFTCPCCGNDTFSLGVVLWEELVAEWKLTKTEEAYINRQQGLACNECHTNLRSMTLAKAMMQSYGSYNTTLKTFLAKHKSMMLLELNEAGNLTKFFTGMKNRTLGSYPEVDIKKLPYPDNSFDMVIHSDTLEHVDDPILGLKEIFRVLRPGGYTCFTIPLVIGRLTKQRNAAQPSYHGSPGNKEYLVQNEYGSDMWTQVIEAGFNECRLTVLEFPSSIGIIGFKQPTMTPTGTSHQIYQRAKQIIGSSNAT